MITLQGFPIPPSDNEIKLPIYRRGGGMTFVDTNTYKKFRMDLQIWIIENSRHLTTCRNELRPLIDNHIPMKFEALCHFHHARVWTQKKHIKKFDVQNRTKALCDAVAKALQIDDSQFFEVMMKKVAIDSGPESVTIKIW